MFIEESKDQASTKLKTQLFVVGEIIEWHGLCEVGASFFRLFKTDERYWCSYGESNVRTQLVRLSRNV